MKTTKKIFAVLFAVLMLTGCMKINYHMDVTDNGEVKFEAIVALPNDWEEQMGQFGDLDSEEDEDTDLDNGVTTESNMNSNVNTNTNTNTESNTNTNTNSNLSSNTNTNTNTNTIPDTNSNENGIDSNSNSNSVEEDPFVDMEPSLDEEALKQRGFTVEPYEEDDMSGYKVTKTYQLSEVSSDSEVIVSLDQYLAEDFDDSKLFQKVSEDDESTTYRAHFVFDASTDSTGDAEIDLSAFASMFDLGYSITLPNGAISSNATTTEGNTLTWKFTYGTKNEVNFDFKISKPADPNKSSKKGLDTTTTIVIAVVAVAVLVAVGGVIVLVKKKGNKKKNAVMNQPVANYPGQVPQQPMPQAQPTVPQQPVAPQQPAVQPQPTVQPQVQAPTTPAPAPTPQETNDAKTNNQQ